MPEEEGAEQLFLLLYRNYVTALGKHMGEVLSEVFIMGDKVFGTAIINDCPANITQLKVGVADIIVKFAVCCLLAELFIAKQGPFIEVPRFLRVPFFICLVKKLVCLIKEKEVFLGGSAI